MKPNGVKWVAFAHQLLLSFIAGVSIAAPLKLAHYFYEKPQVDFFVNGLLLLVTVFLTSKFLKRSWVRQYEGMYLIQWTVVTIAIGWLPLEYWLFSVSEWVHLVSCGLILWTGLVLVIGFKLVQEPPFTFKGYFVFTLVFGIAVWLGFFYDLRQLTVWLMLAFTFTTVFLTTSPKPLVRYLPFAFMVSLMVLSDGFEPPHFFEVQRKYHDKVVFSQKTRFQQIDVTEWKGNHWFYQNGINQFSSIDTWFYNEPFVHPVMHLASKNPKVLIIGGERGLLAKELAKYSVEGADLLPIDHELLIMASTAPIFTKVNENIFSSKLFAIREEGVFEWLGQHEGEYDAIFVDVPDPVDIELNQYYTREFYEMCHHALRENGLVITQAGSPYFATKAFESVRKTMGIAGFGVVTFHNQVLSLGEWGWAVGAKSMNAGHLKESLKQLTFDQVTTQWINQEAMHMMLSFGKPYAFVDDVAINTMKNPVIYQYYNTGNWKF